MKLVVGLGNPGRKYEKTRHNIGFRVLDSIALRIGSTWSEKRAYAQGRGVLAGQKVTLLKPYVFMNRSGSVVSQRARFFGDSGGDLLVVHDELDLDLGTIRLKRGGSTAGHKGLESIVASCGSDDFARVRVGIGRPVGPGSVISYVLSPFTSAESAHLSDVVEGAVEATVLYLEEGLRPAQNAIHGRIFLASAHP